MQRLEVSVAVRPIYGSLGVKRLRTSGTIPLLPLDSFMARTVSTLSSLPFRSPFRWSHNSHYKCKQQLLHVSVCP